LLGIVSRIEQMTHVNVNQDSYTGEGPGYYRPSHPYARHFHARPHHTGHFQLDPSHPHPFHPRH
jgi:hypothetical protein